MIFWAVGTSDISTGQTLTVHWDGTQWSHVPSPSLPSGSSYLMGLAQLSASDLWAVGRNSATTGSASTTLVARYSNQCISPTTTPTSSPTPTFTSTATPTPLLVGHVVWQGPPTPQPQVRQQLPITFTLKLGTTEVNYPSQTTNASGVFTVPVSGLSTGTYSWRAKGPRYLSNSGTVDLTGSPGTSIEIGLMRSGDATNDDVVNAADFNVLRSTFGLCIGDIRYDARADFDNSNCVSSADFNLLKTNYGSGGAPPIMP